MLNFIRLAAGSYIAAHDGVTILITREGASYWSLRVGEGTEPPVFLEAYPTKKAAVGAAHTMCGLEVTAPTSTPKVDKPKKMPWIGHSKSGLYVYNIPELCSVLADYLSGEDTQGVCRPHKGGYFVNPAAANDFWLLVGEDLQGKQVCLQEGKKRQVITVGEM